jgi:GNAT superfamily N-acetyltransferase
MSQFRIKKLARHHAVEKFDCGEAELNRFLVRFALGNQQASVSQTYLGLVNENVIGFYTLVASEVRHEDASERLSTGLVRHPVPLMLLARMGVDTAWQGKQIGAGLLKDAMLRTLHAAEIAGIRAFAVHAKDDRAKAFYKHFRFVESPTDPLHLFLLMKEIKKEALET